MKNLFKNPNPILLSLLLLTPFTLYAGLQWDLLWLSAASLGIFIIAVMIILFKG